MEYLRIVQDFYLEHYILYTLFLLGFLVKDFRNSLKELLAGSVVFSLVILLGTIHYFFYVIVMATINNDIKLVYKLWRKYFVGVYTGIADIMGNIIYRYDEIANVTGGELVEDLVGTEEKTMFGIKRITLSSALGYMKYKKYYMNKFGVWLDL